MELVSCLASGLVLVIIGIAFFIDRILYIRKGNIAIATMFKREERTDSEGTDYIPFFRFTSHSNKEIIFKHRSTQWEHKWRIGDKVKVVYQESILENHEPLPLIFYDTFGLSAGLLTIGIFLLIIAGGIYWEASAKIYSYLLPASMVPFVSAFYIWAQIYFKKLQ